MYRAPIDDEMDALNDEIFQATFEGDEQTLARLQDQMEGLMAKWKKSVGL